MNVADKMTLQRNEFDAADAFAEALRRLNYTAIVDDDYPQMRHEYEGALAGLIAAMKANDRFTGTNRYALASTAASGGDWFGDMLASTGTVEPLAPPVAPSGAEGKAGLYHAVNRMMAAIGADGEINTRHPAVSGVMGELARIDGGQYDESLAALPGAEEAERVLDAYIGILIAEQPEGREWGKEQRIDAMRRALTTLTRPESTTAAPEMPEKDDPIVGHKTHVDETGRFFHTPLRESEAAALMAHIEEEEKERKRLMPDERTAINLMWSAWHRLKDLGWREPSYCPKDGTPFDVIENGSTGIHRTHYHGKWPDGWCVGISSPALFRPLAASAQGDGDGK